MPEGDTVRAIARALAPLVGDVVSVEAIHPRARALRIAEQLDGKGLEGVEARGKNLLFLFESKLVLRSHLMMRGRWLVRPLGESARSTGRPWLRIEGRTHEATRWNGPVLELGRERLANLGPDILDEPAPIEGLPRSLRATSQHRPIADALLDQRVVAGIGNLWRSEILFLARVAPDRRVSDIPDEELRQVMSLAAQLMRAGRDSPQVYRRARRPCRRCTSPIVARRLGEHARVVYWCPVCQAGNTGASA